MGEFAYDEGFYRLALLTISFFVYSFLGWAFEVLYTYLVDRAWVNRGFVAGPVCPIYGVGAILAVVAFSGIDDPLVVGVVGMVSATVLEYFTSWAMEALFHARWWDYSNLPFNLNGRVSLLSSVLFGVMMVFVNHVSQPWLMGVLAPLPPRVVEWAALILSFLFVVDLTSTVVNINRLNERLLLIQRYLGIVGGQARVRAEGAYLQVVRKATEMRDSVSETMNAAGELMRETAADARDLGTSAVESFRRQRSDGLPGQADLLDGMRGLLSPRMSLYDRKAMRDPYFRTTERGEAFELLRSYFAEKRKDG